MKTQATCASLLITALLPLLQADPPETREIDPAKGRVTEDGRFEPAGKPDESPQPTPDPAKRLAELGIDVTEKAFRIGSVELDRETMMVTIPATVNMIEGACEYFLVHRSGKVHESIFTTDAKAQDIHIACLLAGWKPGEKAVEIEIHVTWETNGPPRRHRAEELAAFAQGHPKALNGGTLEQGPWQYIGSVTDAAGFAAAREGSFISLIIDPTSLIGNPRPGRKDDSLHVPNRDLLPAVGHPVRIVISKSEKN